MPRIGTIPHVRLLLAAATLALGCGDDVRGDRGPAEDVAPADVVDAAPDPGADPFDAPPDAEDPGATPLAWSTPLEAWPAAFLSVDGRADDDVWVVGGPVNGASTALHWNGSAWTRVPIEFDGVLWWVHCMEDGRVAVAGEAGSLFVGTREGLERIDTPSLGRHTAFGVVAEPDGTLVTVGGIADRAPFVWQLDADGWRDIPLPPDLPRRAHGDRVALFKAWSDGVTRWYVGGRGVLLRHPHNGAPLRVPLATDAPLFTVTGDADGRRVAVGGDTRAVVVSWDERTPDAAPFIETFDDVALLQGVALGPNGAIWAVGADGAVLERGADAWTIVDARLGLPVESLHAVWVSPSGAVWAVGGDVLSARLERGVVLHGRMSGTSAPTRLDAPPPITEASRCPATLLDLPPDASPARRWNEVALAAIRGARPEPTVHARNLYHLSILAHDAWAATRDDRDGLLLDGQLPDTPRAVEVATSVASAMLVRHRYAHRIGGDRALDCVRVMLDALSLADDVDRAPLPTSDERDAIAFGQALGARLIAAFADDGAAEDANYTDPSWRAANPPLRVDDPGAWPLAPDRWQPLDIARAQTQNGIPEPLGAQGYIGPHWGGVTPFAIRRPAAGATWFVYGERLHPRDERMADEVMTVIESTLALTDDDTLVSTEALGLTSAWVTRWQGDEPVDAIGEPTGLGAWVPRGDFGRALAEYWADGPDSETPPGHWNRLAHQTLDRGNVALRFYGEGPVVDRWEWDVWMLLLLNGALHDAAIVAWEAKRVLESARPISLVRWMAGRGGRGTTAGFAPDGLPLRPGVVERITAETCQPGGRHAHLAAHEGELAIRTWPGDPGNPETQRSEARWVRAAEWVPYQPRTFVSPAFPGYVSGHSTFSHAGATLLHRLLGSPEIPGGPMVHRVRAGEGLEFEAGPSVDVPLVWRTWYDAADQAGASRIWGGIHVPVDDEDGRFLGVEVGEAAAEWGRNRVIGIRPMADIGDPADPIHRGIVPELPDVEVGDPPEGTEGYVLGQGRLQWLPVYAGDSLGWEHGWQGGFHVWLSVRLDADRVASWSDDAWHEINTTFTIERESTGERIASAVRRGGLVVDAQGGRIGALLVLASAVTPESITGEPLRVEAQSAVPGQDPWVSRVILRSACCSAPSP